MALTTHEDIRVEAGFQSRWLRKGFLNSPGVSTNTFYVDNREYVKFVPEFGSGGTIAGVSDVKVYLGLSGVLGTSILGISAINAEQGSVTLAVIPPVGSSVVISYASSGIPSIDVEQVRVESEATVYQRASLCYNFPLGAVAPTLGYMARRLAAATLMIRNYGQGSKGSAQDGYALYLRMIGKNQTTSAAGAASSRASVLEVGEIGMICTPNFILTDENGQQIPRTDSDEVLSSGTFAAGGRIGGRMYDITEEGFRKKDYQIDVDTDQPGSGWASLRAKVPAAVW